MNTLKHPHFWPAPSQIALYQLVGFAHQCGKVANHWGCSKSYTFPIELPLEMAHVASVWQLLNYFYLDRRTEKRRGRNPLGVEMTWGG